MSTPCPLRSLSLPLLLLALVAIGCASAEQPEGGGENNANNANNTSVNSSSSNNAEADAGEPDSGADVGADGSANNSADDAGDDAEDTSGEDAEADAPEVGGDVTEDTGTGDTSPDVEAMPPTILAFTADRDTIVAGDNVALTWEVEGADSVHIAADTGASPGDVEPSGALSVAVLAPTRFTLTATNAAGDVTEAVEVATVQRLLLTWPAEDDALPPATVGVPWSVTLSATGGVQPLTWAIEGALPDGLSLDPTSGELGGTPGEAGTWTFEIAVTDGFAPPQRDAVSATLQVGEAPLPLTITTTTLPDGQVDAPYSAALAATGGAPPLVWSAEGLPEGLSVEADGDITGTPTAWGEFDVVVTARDAEGEEEQADLILNISPTLLSFTGGALPDAALGQPYAHTLVASGGALPWTFLVRELPDGLSADADGNITGTPTAAGTFTLDVTVSDAAFQTALGQATLTVATDPPRIQTSALPSGRINQSYSATLSASGGTAPLSWARVGGALPMGVQLDPGGALSGTPSVAGNFSITVRVTDALGLTDERALSLRVDPDALTITTAALPNGAVGAPYDVTVSATGGIGTRTWATIPNLPPGINQGVTGSDLRLSGTPTQGGLFSFTARVTDAEGTEATRNLSVNVSNAPFAWVTATLPAGATGAPYSTQLQTTGGAGGVTFTLVGALPFGLTLNPATGVISGTPPTPGAVSFTVQARDAANASISRDFTLDIALSIPNGNTHPLLPGSFVDVAAAGATLLPNASSQDDGEDRVDIGFPFVFYGNTYTQLYVGSNGAISFTSPEITFFNSALPNPGDGTHDLIAAFWDDLSPLDGGDVYIQTRGIAPWRQTIIQWRDVAHLSDVSVLSRVNAEIILHETSGQIQLLYGPGAAGDGGSFLHTGASATAGIEDATGANGVEIALEQAGFALAGQVYTLTPEGRGYVLDGWDATDGDFTHIATTGAAQTFANTDDGSVTVNLGFTFRFFGATYTQAVLSTNGFLSFGALPATGTWNNMSLPGPTGYTGIVAAFWDDLTLGAEGRVLTATQGTAPTRRFIAQWDKVARLGETGTRLTFQIVLHERSGDIEIHQGPSTYTAAGTEHGGSATLGIQSPDGTAGLTRSHNQPQLVQGTSAYLTPDRADLITTYQGAGPSAHFIDIRRDAGVTRLSCSDQDDGVTVVSPPFPVRLYGQSYNQLTVSTNGLIGGGSQASLPYSNDPLTDTSRAFALLAPFWDDLDGADGGLRGSVFTATRGAAPNRLFVVQWQELPHNNDLTQSLTFQAVFQEGEPTILYNYGALLPGGSTVSFWNVNSATIGVQSAQNANGGALLGFNQTSTVRAGGQVRVLSAP